MTALQLENVRKVYQSGDGEIVAVDHASLEVGDAEIVALVGPSGSGKTTLLSISGGLLSPSEGRVVVAGDDISGYDPKRLTEFRRESVGFVFQSVNLVPFLTARENLLVVADFGRRDKKKSAARADQLLDELGLDKRKSQPARPALRRRAPAGGGRPGVHERARTWCSSTSPRRRSTPSWVSRSWSSS